MRLTADDYRAAGIKVKEQLRRGADIRDLEAYLEHVARNLADKDEAMERVNKERASALATIDGCAICDSNGFQWRNATGRLVAYDDPEGDTAFRCNHHGPNE